MDMDTAKYLYEYGKQMGFDLPHHVLDQFQEYYLLLVKWNETMNLTAITQAKEVAVKHFLDCICITNYVTIPENAKVIDVGTGAGFPGIPLKIIRPDITLTLLDSLNKRLVFLKEVNSRLGLHAEIIHSRAEDGGRKPELREQFDIATSRAVARLNVLTEYCMPFVKPGGQFIAMKGPGIEEELTSGKAAIKALGGKIEQTVQFTLPDAGERTIVITQKIKKTGDLYPRHGSKIKGKPLGTE